MPESKLKSLLRPLAGETSRQPNINCVVWLLVLTLMQTYNVKKQARQRERQNVQFEEKRSTTKCSGAKSSAQGYESLKNTNEIKGC